MASFLSAFLDPRIESHLIADEGEIVVDEVRRHWMAILPSILQLVLAVLIVAVAFFVDLRYAWFPVATGLVVAAAAGHRILREHMDRFVITNMRVFRVHGIFAQQTATMPMSRILDITVDKPFVGRIFNYGHFVFESAAQDQGLKLIRFVGRPDERDLTIQRVIQRSGLRSSMVPVDPEGDD